jgi:hypothetical protein
MFLSTRTNFLYDSGRTLTGGPSWWGLRKKRAVAHRANRIELLAIHPLGGCRMAESSDLGVVDASRAVEPPEHIGNRVPPARA